MATRVDAKDEEAAAPVEDRPARPATTEERLHPRPNPLREGLRLERMAEPCVMIICGATGDLTDVGLRGNADLYQFLAAVRTREGRLSHIFGKTAVAADGRLTRFGGGFLSATGPDPAEDQAFVGGLFRLLADHQNYVTWTPEAKAEDSAYQTWSMFGYLGIGLFVIGVGAACYYQFRG